MSVRCRLTVQPYHSAADYVTRSTWNGSLDARRPLLVDHPFRLSWTADHKTCNVSPLPIHVSVTNADIVDTSVHIGRISNSTSSEWTLGNLPN